MRLSAVLALLPVALAAPSLRSEPAPLLRSRDAELVADKYIVKLKDESQLSVLDDTLGALTGTVERVYRGIFKGFATTLDEEALDALRSHPDVEYIEQDAIVYANAEQINAPWGLARISSRTPGATSYFHEEIAGTGSCAYIVDTGLDASHPEFGGRAAQVANFADGSGTDGNGHGTHLAGIIGSQTYGVAKRVGLYGVKVLGDSGAGTISAVISGLNFVAEDSPSRNCPNGAVVNISIGGGFSASLNAAAAALVNGGIFVAAAAGNQGQDVANYSPASEPTVCTVGGSDRSDNVGGISNFGALLDIFAPGRDIPSTWPEGGVQTLSGTSMATAHVTGLAAYIATIESPGNTGGLCARLQELATEGVLSGVPEGTVNLLAYNGYFP